MAPNRNGALFESEAAVLRIRRAEEIHNEDGGWFDARWHFSFDHYRYPEQMGVGALRVFNDDRRRRGQGRWTRGSGNLDSRHSRADPR